MTLVFKSNVQHQAVGFPPDAGTPLGLQPLIERTPCHHDAIAPHKLVPQWTVAARMLEPDCYSFMTLLRIYDDTAKVLILLVFQRLFTPPSGATASANRPCH